MESQSSVRTRSIPTAAALIVLGHEPKRIARIANDVFIVFEPAARADLDRFVHAKHRVDDLVEGAV
jgi:hypothetical protein